VQLVDKLANGYLFLILLLLLFLGKYFTKVHVVGPLYLFEAAYVLFFALVLLKLRLRLKYRILYVFALVSIGYLLLSLVTRHGLLGIVMRQYAAFAYFTIFLVCFGVLCKYTRNETYVRYIYLVAVLSVAANLAYLAVQLLMGQLDLKEGYNYLTPLTVMGIIVYAAHVLTCEKRRLLRYLKFGGTLLLSTTTGHSSAFLAVFILPFLVLFFRLKKIMKILVVSLLVVIIGALILFVPQFSDANAQWRLFYWLYVAKEIMVDNFGVLGKGFGVPYASDALAYLLQVEQGASTHLGEGLESYLSPMHNSFLTIFYHIGFLPGLIVFYAHYRYYRFRRRVSDRTVDFLGLSLFGMSVWCSLNVVLELPHSSLYYWLVYFALLRQIELNDGHPVPPATAATRAWRFPRQRLPRQEPAAS